MADDALSYAHVKYAVSYGATADDPLSYACSFLSAPITKFPMKPQLLTAWSYA